MDRFEGATSVRLRGAHGKYLWAEQDHYSVRQENEDKNLQALWRVERNEKGTETLRFKSCFGTYLTASEQRYRGIGFLSFAGKRVTQMRPENVESTNTFDWEPVIDKGRLKLKSCYGTYLRANSSAPPWNSQVTHDLPQHEHHLDWLVWEVGQVFVPNITPLELVIGKIHLEEKEQLPTQAKSKHPDEIPARKSGESERHHVQGKARHPDAERHLGQERINKQGMVLSTRADGSDERLLEERPTNPDRGRVRRAEESERHPVHERERDLAVDTTRSADELGHEGEERSQNPDAGSVRRRQQRIRDPDEKTARRTDDSEGNFAQKRTQKSGVSSVRSRRADESGRHSGHERKRNHVVGTTGAEESVRKEPQRPQVPDVASATSSDESESSRIQERARIPGVETAKRTNDLEWSPAHERFQNPGVSTSRRADESQRRRVQDRDKNPDVGTPIKNDDPELRPVQKRYEIFQNSAVGTDESQRRLLRDRDRNPDVGTPIRTDDPERRPVPKRYEKYQKPAVGTARRAQESERLHEQEAASRDQGSVRHPVQETTRRAQESEALHVQEAVSRDQGSARRPVQETTRRAQKSETLHVQEAASRDQGSARRPVQETTRRAQELELPTVQETTQRDQESESLSLQKTARRSQRSLALETRRARASERHPVPENFINPELSTGTRPNESDRYSMQEMYENLDGATAGRVHKSEGQSSRGRFKTLDMGTARNAEESELNSLTGRERDPGINTGTGAHESDPYPVYYPEEDITKHLVVTSSRRADEITESHRKATSRPHR